jgi:hypothetical protein
MLVTSQDLSFVMGFIKEDEIYSNGRVEEGGDTNSESSNNVRNYNHDSNPTLRVFI